MHVERTIWEQKVKALMDRRKSYGHPDDNRKLDNPVRDYHLHMSKVFVGKSVLDVGCGSQFLKECLPEGTLYFGLDPYPVEGYETYKGKIEDSKTVSDFAGKIDTVCAFAMLDSSEDFDAAIWNMRHIAGKNIVILTGIGIAPDAYHTFRLELSDFRDRMGEFKETLAEEIAPKVYLLEYRK